MFMFSIIHLNSQCLVQMVLEIETNINMAYPNFFALSPEISFGQKLTFLTIGLIHFQLITTLTTVNEKLFKHTNIFNQA